MFTLKKLSAEPAGWGTVVSEEGLTVSYSFSIQQHTVQKLETFSDVASQGSLMS
jgi:hypothetical protein